MVDNFELIRNALSFRNEKSFYFVQVLKRKKENPEMKSYSRPIESFYVFSKESLDAYMPHIIEKCEQNRARAYIKMNCLDAERVMHESAIQMIREADAGHWKAMSSVLNSACGMCGKQDGNEKLYLVDIDDEFVDRADEIEAFIETECEPITEKKKLLLKVPTRNGLHFLTTGFNKQRFRSVYSGIDVHDDGITLLYFPKSCDEKIKN